jgi:hypothetical protein
MGATGATGTTGEGDQLNRKRAALYILPFLLLGLGNLALLLGWGLRPLWGFLILPPILFVSVLGYIAFRTGLVGNRLDTDDGREDDGHHRPDDSRGDQEWGPDGRQRRD